MQLKTERYTKLKMLNMCIKVDSLETIMIQECR